MIVFVGLILGVGILVMDKFGEAAKTSTTIVNDTVTFSGGTGTTTNDDLTSLTSIVNESGSFTYLSSTYNFTSAGVINMDKNLTDVVNESVAAVGAASVSLTSNDVTVITSIVNETGAVNYRTPQDYNFTEAGSITFARNISNNTVLVTYTYNRENDGDHLVSYVYDKDSTATTSLGNTASAISDISTSWLSLIITIAILAIILSLVIRSFAVKR